MLGSKPCGPCCGQPGEGDTLSRLRSGENPWARRNLLAADDVEEPPSLGAELQRSDRGNLGDEKEMSGPAGPAPVTMAGATALSPAADEPPDVLIAWYATDRQRVEAVPPQRRLPIWSGPVRPHLGGTQEESPQTAAWWWLGVHGGSGVSTLAAFLPGGADAQRYWPDPAHGGPRAVVLVCRTHLVGLERARDAARQWASADVPAGLLLGGAVAVADAPGRLTRSQSEALRLLAGVVPRLWAVPWIEDLRAVAVPGRTPVPPALVKLGSDLEGLRARGSRPARGPR